MTGKYNRVTNPIRTRSYHDLIDEIQHVSMDYNLNYFKLVDATFDKDVDTVLGFCETKVKRLCSIPWEANIHPGFAQDERAFEALAEANCEQINIGVESGSPYVLSDIGKGTSVERIKKVFEWAKKYGIKRRAFVLLGMPVETEDDHLLTEALLDEMRPDVVGFTILAPYPGSDYYNQDFKYVDWSEVDEYSNAIWHTQNFSNKQLKETQARFVEKYSKLLCERQL
jgi:radical SAM superfamily enzyme YgiQ (UPF0313 family)